MAQEQQEATLKIRKNGKKKKNASKVSAEKPNVKFLYRSSTTALKYLKGNLYNKNLSNDF